MRPFSESTASIDFPAIIGAQQMHAGHMELSMQGAFSTAKVGKLYTTNPIMGRSSAAIDESSKCDV
jgi:hypothetical protein